MPRKDASWVVVGGALGEVAHCRRCGEGLVVITPRSSELQLFPMLTMTKALAALGCRMEIWIAATKAFASAHGKCRESGYVEPVPLTPLDWIASRDVGVSAATIWSVVRDTPSPLSRYDVPHDAGDFGRCHRLLTRFGWHKHLSAVAAKFPEWSGLVARWNDLETAHLTEDFDGVNRLMNTKEP